MLAHAAAVDQPPRVFHVSYAKQRPEGADHAYWGLRVPTFDPDGRVIGMQVVQVEPRARIDHLDGGCYVPRANGVRHDWIVPGYRPPGHYRFRITVSSSSCVAGDRGHVRTVTRTLRIPVPKRLRPRR